MAFGKRPAVASDYEAAIAAFIRSKGITRCPTACVVPTQATVGAADRAALRERAIESEARRARFSREMPGRMRLPSRGNPDLAEASAKGRIANKRAADHFAGSLRPIVEAIQASGITGLAAIAEALNTRGVTAPRGGKWRGSAVRRVLDRIGHI